MNRRNFLQMAGTMPAIDLSALEEGVADHHERSRSFIRSLPIPDQLADESGYAFTYATDKVGIVDSLPTADAYGTIITSEAKATAALGPDERRPSASELLDQGYEPTDRYEGRPVFIDQSHTRHKMLVPGTETTVFGVGPIRRSIKATVTALFDGQQGSASGYYEESSTFQRLADYLGVGNALSAEVRPDGIVPGVIARGRCIRVHDDLARVRSVALFEPGAISHREMMTTKAAQIVPPLDITSNASTTVKWTDHAIIRETMRPRAAFEGGDCDD